MPIVNFRFTGNAQQLRITATVIGNDNHLQGTECSCYLAPLLDEKLLNTITLEQQEYKNWLNGGISPVTTDNSSTNLTETNQVNNFSQSAIDHLKPTNPPIEITTNNQVFAQCRRLGDLKVTQFQEWIDTPPSRGSDGQLLENSASLREKLCNILSIAQYNENRNNCSFVIQTDTDNHALDLQLQRFPFHTWGFIANYPNAEVTFSTTSHSILQSASDRVRVFVILGHDANINCEPHRQAIEQYLTTDFADVEYWSCDPDSPYHTPESVQQPRQNLNLRLERSISEQKSPTILIFVGHSSSNQRESSCQIGLNDSVYISPKDRDMSDILKRLREQGLIFTAFFSCDGLEIAHELRKSEIPYILVSRDKIPVHVALTSITQFFLKATQPGVSINIAVNHVRRYLQNYVDTVETSQGCPNASNLLVLFQNPVQPSYILRPISGLRTYPENWWQKNDEFLKRLFPNRILRFLMMLILGICLVCIPPIVISIINPPYITACEIPDIREKPYISCGDKNLFYKDNKDAIHLYPENTIKTIKKEAANNSEFDNSWKKYIENKQPDLAIALSNEANNWTVRSSPMEKKY